MKIRTWIVLALSCVVSSQTLALDFSTRVETLPNLLKAYGEKTGRTMKASPDLRNEALFVSVTEVEPAKIDEEIANILNAKWFVENNVWVLRREKSNETQSKSAFDARLNQVQLKLTETRAMLNGLPPITDESSKALNDRIQQAFTQGRSNPDFQKNIRNLFSQTASGRFAIEVALSIPAVSYNQLPPFGRVVLAIRPNQAQLALNSKIFNSAQEFANSQPEGGPFSMMGGGGANFAAITGGPGGRGAQAPIDKTVAQVWAVVTRENLDQSYTVTVTAENAAGQLLLTAAHNLTVNTPQESAEITKLDHSAKIEIPSLEAAFLKNINQLQNFAGNFMAGGFGGGRGRGAGMAMAFNGEGSIVLTKPTQKQISEIKDINGADPLNIGHQFALKSIADDGHDVIALVPDELGPAFSDELLQTAYSTENYINDIQTKAKMVVNTENSWVRIRPSDLGKTTNERFDRIPFKTMMKRVTENGSVSLDDRAEYALSTPTMVNQSAYDMRLALIFAPFPSYSLWNGIWDNSRPILKLYGSFSPQQKLAMRNKQSVEIRSINPEIAKQISFYTFSSVARPSVLGGDGRNFFASSGYSGERTTVLGTSIPPDAKIYLNLSTSLLALARNSNDGYSFVDPMQLAVSTSMSSSPLRTNIPAGALPTYLGYSNATSETIEVVIEMRKNYGLTAQFRDFQYNLNAKLGGVDTLSQEFQKEYAKSSEDMKGVFDRMQMGRGNNGQP